MPAAPTLRTISSLKDVAPEAWDKCANPAKALAGFFESKQEIGAVAAPPAESLREPLDSTHADESFNPFITHAFLSALEESGSVGPKTGWSPVHLLLEDGEGRLMGAAPCYLKSHSYGEYVFDHGWAEAYERAGGAYYPKLQVAAPFTPVPGRRLLLAEPDNADHRALLIAGLRALMRQSRVSSLHVTFPDAQDWRALGEAGLLQRTGQQFHFFNPGYASFEDFLATLASRKRKAIRKERAAALQEGIEIEWATGAGLREAHWDAFFEFYMDTGARKWGRPYLNRRFFSLIGERLADRILLVMARRGGRYIAGALNFIGDAALYGRNWGAIEDVPFLHFELCYYQAIDFAIARGLKRVEAGAQGEHKLARGYVPVPTFSAHAFADPRLSAAIEDFLARERRAVDGMIAAYAEDAPYKKA
ncbi:MAG: N-acetyltransferase [Hyphomicrobiales bacterium]|nr:N-acetyltransferase [Hyphomicrobiales bacterium]